MYHGLPKRRRPLTMGADAFSAFVLTMIGDYEHQLCEVFSVGLNHFLVPVK